MLPALICAAEQTALFGHNGVVPPETVVLRTVVNITAAMIVNGGQVGHVVHITPPVIVKLGRTRTVQIVALIMFTI